MTSHALPRIGACPCCLTPSRLASVFCAECVGRFGLRFAALVVRVRADRQFARLCFEALSREARPRFIEMFGDPLDEEETALVVGARAQILQLDVRLPSSPSSAWAQS